VHYAILSGAVFGRPSHGNHQGAVGHLFQPVFPILANLLDNRIGYGTQVGVVLCKGPVLKEMLRIPGTGGNIPLPPVTAKDTLTCASCPSAGLRSKRLTGGNTARFKGCHHKVEQRGMALRQIGRLSCPIVHLHVNIVVIIACPGRFIAVVPEPLQIGGQPSRARRTDKQIAAIFKHQHLQFRIDGPFGISL